MQAKPTPITRPRAARLRNAACRGFTIFELSMAVMIMAFALATSVTVLQMGFRALDTARNTTIASQLLQSVMEDLRMLPWSATSPANSISSLQAANNNVAGNVTLDASFTNGDPAATAMVSRFTLTRNITDVDSVMKRIQLTATWRGIDGRAHSLSYTSYYGRNGLHDYIIR
jgi:Tfp pilus assembly protein PilV